MYRLLLVAAFVAVIQSLSAQSTGDTVRAVYVDEFNVKWFGTDLGLLRFDGLGWMAYHTRNETPGMVNDIVYADGENGQEIWIGTDNGVTVAAYNTDGVTSATRYHSGNSELQSNKINAIVLDTSDTKYFATPDGLGIFEVDQWTWLERGWGPSEGGISNYPLLSLGAKNDTVYAGAASRGAGRVINEIDGFSGASYYEVPWTGIAGNTVKSILTDSEGYQWFGTTDGVSQHTTQEGDVGWDLTLTTTDGLVDNTVNAIFEDSNGGFWMGTDAGVSKYDPGESSFTNYTESDGLANNMVFDIAEDTDHLLWFATADGVSSFDGENFTHYATGEQAKDFINIVTSVRAQEISQEFNPLKVYPNPVSSHLYVHLSGTINGVVEVSVYDPSGRLTKQLYRGMPGEGDLKVRWDLDDGSGNKVPHGIYIITVDTDHRRYSCKTIIQ